MKKLLIVLLFLVGLSSFSMIPAGTDYERSFGLSMFDLLIKEEYDSLLSNIQDTFGLADRYAEQAYHHRVETYSNLLDISQRIDQFVSNRKSIKVDTSYWFESEFNERYNEEFHSVLVKFECDSGKTAYIDFKIKNTNAKFYIDEVNPFYSSITHNYLDVDTLINCLSSVMDLSLMLKNHLGVEEEEVIGRYYYKVSRKKGERITSSLEYDGNKLFLTKKYYHENGQISDSVYVPLTKKDKFKNPTGDQIMSLLNVKNDVIRHQKSYYPNGRLKGSGTKKGNKKMNYVNYEFDGRVSSRTLNDGDEFYNCNKIGDLVYYQRDHLINVSQIKLFHLESMPSYDDVTVKFQNSGYSFENVIFHRSNTGWLVEDISTNKKELFWSFSDEKYNKLNSFLMNNSGYYTSNLTPQKHLLLSGYEDAAIETIKILEDTIDYKKWYVVDLFEAYFAELVTSIESNDKTRFDSLLNKIDKLANKPYASKYGLNDQLVVDYKNDLLAKVKGSSFYDALLNSIPVDDSK